MAGGITPVCRLGSKKAVQGLRDERKVTDTALRDWPCLQSGTWILLRKITAYVVAKLVPELAFHINNFPYQLRYFSSTPLVLSATEFGFCNTSRPLPSLQRQRVCGWFVWRWLICLQPELSVKPPSSQGKDMQIPTKLCLCSWNQLPWHRLAALAFNFQ